MTVSLTAVQVQLEADTWNHQHLVTHVAILLASWNMTKVRLVAVQARMAQAHKQMQRNILLYSEYSGICL